METAKKGQSVTIAIPTYNRGAVLLETLNYLGSFDLSPATELLVIDQTSVVDEGLPRACREACGSIPIRYIQQRTPSLTEARNRALREAENEIILFLDDDVWISKELVRAHAAAFCEPGVGAVTGQVYQYPVDVAPTDQNEIPLDVERHFHQNKAGPCSAVIGCNHSVRKEAAMAIGGYDENFTASAHCEDFDLAKRLVASGWTVWYEPNAWLTHRKAQVGGCRVFRYDFKKEWMNTYNFFYFIAKHDIQSFEKRALLFQLLRAGPLRKEIIKRPCLWIGSWCSVRKAYRSARSKRLEVSQKGP